MPLTAVFSWVTRLLIRTSVLDLDLDSGLVKTSHHCVFDEVPASSNRLPAAQMMFNLGYLVDVNYLNDDDGPMVPPLHLTTYPPLYLNHSCQSRRA